MNEPNFKLGITKTFDCNYLPEKEERLLIAIDERLQTSENYSWLMSQGFRRSGEQIYRPHCPKCTACKSIRVLAEKFTPSKSQKRLLKKAEDFKVVQSSRLKEDYFPLYEQYINTIHFDGAMYPASKEQFKSFLSSGLTKQLFIETWHLDKLISVAVTDELTNALSAVYTFYDPSYKSSGLGVLSILKQLLFCQRLNKKYLYLGYQIDDCQKMNYKNRYYPFEQLEQNTWIIVNK